MNWNRIVEKLTSRKFWAAIGSFVSLVLVSQGMAEAEAAQIVAIIMAGATVIAYIIGEGLVDAHGAGSHIVIESAKPPENTEE